MPSLWSRRDLLKLSSASLGVLTGCTASPSSSLTTETTMTDRVPTTPGITSTHTPLPGESTIENVRVMPELVVPNSPDSIGIVGDRSEQSLLVTVSSTGALPNREEFSLQTAGASYISPPAEEVLYGGVLWDNERGYTSLPDNLLIFSLPKPLDVTEAMLHSPSGKHRMPDSILQTLARPPTEFVIELSAPEVVKAGDEVAVTVTIENTGKTTEMFVGALNRQGPEVAYTPVEGITLNLEPGESKQWTHTYRTDFSYSFESPRAMFSLVWRQKTQTRTVHITSESE